MHHKFVVIDFDKPTARVYVGSYNFSISGRLENGENLLLIRDRRVAASYMVEALRIFDHYQFRVSQLQAATAATSLNLQEPPAAGKKAWWTTRSPFRSRSATGSCSLGQQRGTVPRWDMMTS